MVFYYFYLADHRRKDWSQRTAPDNRAAVSQLIRQGRMHGYLAYIQGRPVAWCHAAARVDLPNLQDSAELHVADVEQVGAIVCFLVARPYRRLGIARWITTLQHDPLTPLLSSGTPALVYFARRDL